MFGSEAMFAAAWGERAADLLERAAAGAGISPERDGPLAICGAQGAAEAGWRCWISGRLTNSQELQKLLGLPFAMEAPRLLAHAYARFGHEACRLLRGQFVVVALDLERRTASVVRDQLGGRPLLHARVGDDVLFAEHERAIVDLLPSVPSPDRLALVQWIERGSMAGERTLFEGVRRMPPAHIALLSAGGWRIEQYWRARYEGTAPGSRAEIAARLRAAAFAAVERAAEDAQTPAVLLSGGLDSSCVAAGLAARARPARQALALAGVFPTHPESDERALIEATAAHTKLPVELIPFDDRSSILAPALQHIERWSLPPATPNLFAWEPVMARARELGVDAMLDGEGGDELFAFAPQLIADRIRSGRVLAAWRLTRRIPTIGADADTRMRLRALRVYGTSHLLAAPVRRWRRSRRTAEMPSSLLQPADRAALLAIEDDAQMGDLDEGPMWWRGLAEGLTAPGEALGVSAHLRREATDERIDRRHPFLFDLELLQTVLSNPPLMQFEIRDRALMRDALTGHIPEAVRTRHEKSFFTGLLSTGLAADGELLAEGPARRDAPVRAFVRAEALEALLEQGPTPQDVRAARRLWQVGLADAWLRALDDPERLRDMLEKATAQVADCPR